MKTFLMLCSTICLATQVFSAPTLKISDFYTLIDAELFEHPPVYGYGEFQGQGLDWQSEAQGQIGDGSSGANSLRASARVSTWFQDDTMHASGSLDAVARANSPATFGTVTAVSNMWLLVSLDQPTRVILKGHIYSSNPPTVLDNVALMSFGEWLPISEPPYSHWEPLATADASSDERDSGEYARINFDSVLPAGDYGIHVILIFDKAQYWNTKSHDKARFGFDLTIPSSPAVVLLAVGFFAVRHRR